MHSLLATNHELTEQHLGTFQLSRRVFVDLVDIDRSQISVCGVTVLNLLLS